MATWLSGPVGEVTAAGWAKVENQEDMADFALVRASPTDWPEGDDRTKGWGNNKQLEMNC